MLYSDAIKRSSSALNPRNSGIISFEEMLGYTFAQAICSKNAWSPEATPSHIVTTYPAALQSAYSEIRHAKGHSAWWNELYETTPMFELYTQDLHKAVDLACKEHQWSDTDKQALHNYVTEFMGELKEPKHNLGTVMCQQTLLAFGENTVKGLMKYYDVTEEKAEQGLQFLKTAANVLASSVPENANFESTFGIIGFAEVLNDEAISAAYEDEEQAVRDRYPIEGAVLKAILMQCDGMCSTNISVQEAKQADAFQEQLPRIALKIMDNSNVRLDALHSFHDGEIGLGELFDSYAEDYLEAIPELQERYDKEAACFWDWKHQAIYSEDFTTEEILRGFTTPRPITDELVPCVEPMLNNMSLQERQDFLQSFEEHLMDTPLDATDALIQAFKDWRFIHQPTKEIEYGWMLSSLKIAAHDMKMSNEMLQFIPANQVVEQSLQLFEQHITRAGIDAQLWSTMQASIRATPIHISPEWTYAELYALMDEPQQILKSNTQWQAYFKSFGIPEVDTYGLWREVVRDVLRTGAQYGGYEFQSIVAQDCALWARGTFNMLPIPERRELAEHLEREAQSYDGNTSKLFRNACERLSIETQTNVAAQINIDCASMQYRDEYQINLE